MKPKPKKNDQSAGGGKGIKPVNGWACVSPKGQLILSTCALKSAWAADFAECMWHENICDNKPENDKFWCDMAKEGYRIVRVRVEVV